VHVMQVIYVCVWAGKDVEELSMHPAYNLCLRLLHELTMDIIIPAPANTLNVFDAKSRPSRVGTGFTIKCSVERHAASTTTVTVRSSLTSSTEFIQILCSIRFPGQPGRSCLNLEAWRRSKQFRRVFPLHDCCSCHGGNRTDCACVSCRLCETP
jgi:hypothetical protein